MMTWDSALDGRLKQRAGNCLLYCLQCLVVTLGLYRYRYVRYPCPVITVCTSAKSRLISAGRLIRSVIPCTACCRYLVCLLQCLRHGSSAVHDLQKLVVRDHDQSIHVLFQLLDTCKCIVHTRFLPRNGTAWSQRQPSGYPSLLQCSCHNRSCTGTGTAAHTTGNEYHVCTLDRFFDLLSALLGCLLADLRLCACAQVPWSASHRSA